jgi:hypothetical protein
MKITRKTNVFVKTVRKFIVHRQETDETVFCDRCNEEMISAQEAANFFGVSSRRIYRSIESEKIHFAETAHNEIYVCLISIKQILNSAE